MKVAQFKAECRCNFILIFRLNMTNIFNFSQSAKPDTLEPIVHRNAIIPPLDSDVRADVIVVYQNAILCLVVDEMVRPLSLILYTLYHILKKNVSLSLVSYIIINERFCYRFLYPSFGYFSLDIQKNTDYIYLYRVTRKYFIHK